MLGKKLNVEGMRICPRCKNAFILKYEGYCKTCKSALNKEYRETHPDYFEQYNKDYYSRQFIYIIWGVLDGIETPLYIGSTCRPHRINEHLRGYNGTTTEQYLDANAYKVTYANVTGLVHSKKERFYLEDLYILEYEPVFNKGLNNVEIEEEVMENLGEVMYNDCIEFEEMDIKKVTTPSQVVTFDFDNLVLR